jgi:hypothetical protein
MAVLRHAEEVTGNVAVNGAIIQRQPVGLGVHQRVAHLAQDIAVGRAALATMVVDGDGHHVGHLGDHVQTARQFRRRVQHDIGGVHVARIGRGVDDHAGGPPLPRHRVFAAGIEGHIDKLRQDVAAVGDDGRIQRLDQPFADEGLHIGIGRHDDVEAVPTLANPCQRGVVAVEIGDVDGDAGFGGEPFKNLGAGVVAPVVEVHDPLRAGQRGRTQ